MVIAIRPAVLSALVLPAIWITPIGASQKEPSPQPTSSEQLLTPVIQSVISTPRWYPGDDGRVHMQYELMLTNTLPLPVDVTSLDVSDGGGRLIETLSGDQLKAAMTLLGSGDNPTTKLPAATVGVVWIDVSFASRRQLPREIKHRLTVDVGPGLPVGPTFTDNGGQASVATRGPVVVGPPLDGGPWVAIGGPEGPHRRALQAVHGQLRLGQRFAVDFSARLDAQDRTHIGSPDENQSYFNYGQAVLAVASGTVVEAVDRLADQVPNHNVGIPLSEADGNHIILKLGDDVFAGYAHLKPGSVLVKRGDRVRRGQVLGRLGNSGESTGPHLHFQLMTRPSLLDADGLPFIFDRFTFDGRIPSLKSFIDADREGTPVPVNRSEAGSRSEEGITGLAVLSFRVAAPGQAQPRSGEKEGNR